MNANSYIANDRDFVDSLALKPLDTWTAQEQMRLHNIATLAASSKPYGPSWLSPKDKPAHLPGEHHSEDVLIVMIDSWSHQPAIRIGHVSLGHWRPSGGNGNFDDDVIAWMPLPALPKLLKPSTPDSHDATKEQP